MKVSENRYSCDECGKEDLTGYDVLPFEIGGNVVHICKECVNKVMKNYLLEGYRCHSC